PSYPGRTDTDVVLKDVAVSGNFVAVCIKGGMVIYSVGTDVATSTYYGDGESQCVAVSAGGDGKDDGTYNFLNSYFSAILLQNDGSYSMYTERLGHNTWYKDDPVTVDGFELFDVSTMAYSYSSNATLTLVDRDSSFSTNISYEPTDLAVCGDITYTVLSNEITSFNNRTGLELWSEKLDNKIILDVSCYGSNVAVVYRNEDSSYSVMEFGCDTTSGECVFGDVNDIPSTVPSALSLSNNALYLASEKNGSILHLQFTSAPIPPDEPSGLPGWAIALIVVGSVLVVAGIVVLIVFCFKTKKDERKRGSLLLHEHAGDSSEEIDKIPEEPQENPEPIGDESV
ncbi:hypothetical protein ADUPG1_006765, partial [Aduncisulcus paluster]